MQIYLPAFAGFGNKPINSDKFFKGCGGNTPEQLNYLEVRNYDQGDMTLVLDRVRLV